MIFGAYISLAMFYLEDEVFFTIAGKVHKTNRLDTLEFCGVFFFSLIVVIDILRKLASTVLSHLDSLQIK